MMITINISKGETLFFVFVLILDDKITLFHLSGYFKLIKYFSFCLLMVVKDASFCSSEYNSCSTYLGYHSNLSPEGQIVALLL